MRCTACGNLGEEIPCACGCGRMRLAVDAGGVPRRFIRGHHHRRRDDAATALRQLKERFWAKVEKTDQCWIWTGARTEGYGRISPAAGVNRLAYRLAYEWLVGPIPEGLRLDHLCRNRACVNPAHLEPVTNRENILRGESPQAANAAKTHCVNGHEFSDENTWRDRNGWRQCRTCNRARTRKRKAALRARRAMEATG